MNLKSRNVLFLDLQTTGANPASAHILEIAWSTSHSENVESYLIKQPEGELIPHRIKLITGVSEKDMAQAKEFPQVYSRLSDFLETNFEDEVLAIIHFAQFEKPFLTDAFAKLQVQMPFTIQCTHEIAKRLMPNLPTRGIKGLAGYFGFPSGELKRAASHVQATKVIWQGLASLLSEQNILTFEQLKEWCESTPKGKRVKYEYPLAKEKRLGLPKQPGVYRMLSQWNEVLYVGKATNLHDRVNSYFRGQKNRDQRKLEMLTQVWDLQVTPVGSPLEAALLETDEIKRLDPPYNISLKAGNRSLAFFNRDFTSVSAERDQDHTIGPFSNAMVFDSIIKLSHSLKEGVFDENLFFDPFDPDLLKEGFELFCQNHQLDPNSFCSVRASLAVGLNWARIKKEDSDVAGEMEGSEEEPLLDDNKAELSDEAIAIVDSPDIPITPSDIADKFERHFIRAARAYWRAKKINQIMNADIYFENSSKDIKGGLLRVRQGQLVIENRDPLTALDLQTIFSVETYDRMTVLLSELQKLQSQKGSIKIIKSRTAPLDSNDKAMDQ